jgi:hypothetical protein
LERVSDIGGGFTRRLFFVRILCPAAPAAMLRQFG